MQAASQTRRSLPSRRGVAHIFRFSQSPGALCRSLHPGPSSNLHADVMNRSGPRTPIAELVAKMYCLTGMQLTREGRYFLALPERLGSALHEFAFVLRWLFASTVDQKSSAGVLLSVDTVCCFLASASAEWQNLPQFSPHGVGTPLFKKRLFLVLALNQTGPQQQSGSCTEPI